jgi:cell division septation protein DedD
MKQLMKYVLVGVSAVFLIQACGPNEAELQKREQARLDSLERASLQRIQQSRMDSIAVAQRLELEATSMEEDRRTIQYQANGRFTVQVGSWRSQTFANNQLELWRSRGFVNAYIVEFGNEEVGEVWFRIRLGRVASRNDAVKLQDLVIQDYNIAGAWISSVQ